MFPVSARSRLRPSCARSAPMFPISETLRRSLPGSGYVRRRKSAGAKCCIRRADALRAALPRHSGWEHIRCTTPKIISASSSGGLRASWASLKPLRQQHTNWRESSITCSTQRNRITRASSTNARKTPRGEQRRGFGNRQRNLAFRSCQSRTGDVPWESPCAGHST